MADVKKKKNQAKEKYSKEAEKAKTKGGKKPFIYHLIPYVLVVLAIWLVMCFVTTLISNPHDILGAEERQGDHALSLAGYYTSAIFMGTFGPAAFAIPVIFVLFIVFWHKYSNRSLMVLNSVLAVLAVVIISALCHIFAHSGEGVGAFVNDFNTLYREGVALGGGGFVGGYIAFLLYPLAKIGAVFVLFVILVPMVLFLFGTTPVEAVKWIAEKIKAARARAAIKAKARAEQRAIERKEEKAIAREREKEERAFAIEQERLDRAQAREQEKLDREAAREQAKFEREQARFEREQAKNKPADVESEDGETLILPDEPEKANNARVIINLPDYDQEDTAVEATRTVEETVEEEEESLTLSAFSSDEKQHIDGLKEQGGKSESAEEPELDGLEIEDEIINSEGETVVFVDPKSKGKSARGVSAVDDMMSEMFDGEQEIEIDETTGEVFTPVVQTKAPKSADEFRAQNETKEDHFIGEKPEPMPIPEYEFPPVDLLELGSSRYSSDPEELEQNAEILRGVLQDFRIPIKEISCSCGPTLTRYEIKPEAGVRVRQIANLVDDISMALAKTGVRIEAPIPGKAAVGVEVPNDKPAAVKLRNILEHADFISHKSSIAACLGADVSGKPMIFDIEKMPHLLVAGTTGSGKSVCINSIIMSILYHAKPSEVKLLLIDPKKVEFKVYRDIPHLCCRIVSDPKKAAGALNSAVNEMEKRFELIEEVGVRNIAGYNEITKNDPDKPYMPRLVIIIDEFADLMMTAKDEVETAVVRIAQKARAAGIHLIIGTQRPSVDVITGLIKANIPSRIAFTVMSGIDSRTILDTVGAEKLCGRGDMLYAPVGAQKPLRVQGAFVSDEEVERVVDYVKSHNARVIYDQEFESSIDVEAAKCGNAPEKSETSDFKGGAGDEDPKLFDAAELAIDAGKISTSLLQRRLEVGYGRAAKIIDRLEEMGFVGPADGNKPRKILITKEELDEYLMNRQ